MSHFTAQLVYQLFDARHPGDRYLLETRIFEASDALLALEAARITGESQTVTETDVTGHLVRKAFIGVKSVEAFLIESGRVVCESIQTYDMAAAPAKTAVRKPALMKLLPAVKQKAS